MAKSEPAKAPERRLEYMPLAAIQGAARNPKGHSSDIGESIGRFGYVEPVVIDERTGKLVAGHGRVESLKARQQKGEAPPEGVKEKGVEWLLPVLRGWASRSDTEAEAYLLASNQLTIAGGWNDEQLAAIVRDLEAAGAIDGLGFDEDEVARLLGEGFAPAEGETDPDDVPEESEEPWVKVGDLFALGEHRIVCGDCTNAEDVKDVLDGTLADICWTDPPWNIDYDGEASRGRPSKGRPVTNDNLGEAFPGFCAAFAGSIRQATKPGAPIYLAMSASEWPTIHAALSACGFHWSSSIIWAKDVFNVRRKDYHAQYEPIWYGWNDEAPRLVQLEDRTQSDLWTIARPKRSDEHPTMKPVELVARALTNSSRPKAIVFEPFSGSGSTLIACEQLKRRCRAIELEPKYVQVAIERWEKFTGKKAEKL